jgi:hypothetical protein
MSAKPKKRIAPTLVTELPAANNTNNNAFEAAAQKKNPLENAADMIAMRYGISAAAAEAPQIDEAVFAKNRAIGKKVVPLKEYFEQTAKDFKEKEAVKKEETAKKKREYAKLTPCQRKMNTLQRNLDGYIGTCDRNLSNEALIEMADKARSKARTKASASSPVKKTRTRKPKPQTPRSRSSRSAKGSQ